MSNIQDNTPANTDNTPARTQNTQAVSQKNKSLPTPQELVQLTQVCETLSRTPFYQKLGPGGVLAIWLTALELGLPPMMALNSGLWTFDGKVSMSAQTMNYMIVSKGHRADIIELNDTKCTIRFVRGDRKEASTYTHTYTTDDAKKAGLLGKDNWRKNPRDMLFNRCLSSGARKFMPDVLMQGYTHEELCDSDPEFEKNFQTKDLNYDTQEVQANNDKGNETKNQENTSTNEIPRKDYEDFVAKWGLNIEESPELAYVKEIAKETNKTEEHIIKIAIRNEEKFENGFNRWMQQQTTKTA